MPGTPGCAARPFHTVARFLSRTAPEPRPEKPCPYDRYMPSETNGTATGHSAVGRFFRRFLGLKPATLTWGSALRLTSCITVPMIVLTAFGMQLEAMLSALGSYVVMFGAGQPGRRRLKVFLVMTAVECLSVVVGLLTAGSVLTLVPAMIALATGGVLLDRIFTIGPPGPYYPVLLAGIGLTLAQSGMTPPLVLPWLLVGAALAIVAGMSDLFGSPHHVEDAKLSTAQDAVGKLEERTGPPVTEDEVPEEVTKAASAMAGAWRAGMGGAAGALHPGDYGKKLRHRLLALQGRWLRAASRTLLDASPDPRTWDSVEQLTETAIGPPSQKDRLLSVLVWPSPTTLNYARMILGVILGGIAVVLLQDQKPFWLFSVIVLILSFHGDQHSLTWRAVDRALGTFAGLGIFMLLGVTEPGPWVMAISFSALLVLISLISSRNYFWGSIAITIMALLLVSGLSSTPPTELAKDRWTDTLAAVVISLALLWGLGPAFVPAMLRRSVRSLRRTESRLMCDLDRGTPLTDPGYVRTRRRMQSELSHTQDVDSFLSTSARHNDRISGLKDEQRRAGARGLRTLLRCAADIGR